MRQAGLLLGCYRTGDANDPEVYAAAIIAVLSDYSLEVMRLVCDPRCGLPSRVSWLPTVAEVKSACNLEAERLDRIAKYQAMPAKLVRLAGPRVSRANVRVSPSSALYPKAVVAARDVKARAEDWRPASDGIWVTLDWAMENGGRAER